MESLYRDIAARFPPVATGLTVCDGTGPGTVESALKPFNNDASTRDTSNDFQGRVGSGG